MGFWTAIPIIGDVIKAICHTAEEMHFSGEEKATLDNARKIIEQNPKLAELAIEKLEREGFFKTTLAQLEINLSDSKGNWFQRCWRPSIGYVCAASLFFASLLPLATCSIIWSVNCFGMWQILPFPMEFNTLTEMLATNLTGMLGMSYFRTREKEKGVQGKH